MAKSEVYLAKLEAARERPMTGMRLKMVMYNAKKQCYVEGAEFPYQKLLEEYCIPGKEGYIEDRKYYAVREDKIIETERIPGEAEVFLGELAAKTGGKLVYGRSREPMLLLEGMLLTASKLKEGTYYTEEYEEDYSVPFELYPRVINIANGAALVETAEGVLDWQKIPK